MQYGFYCRRLNSHYLENCGKGTSFPAFFPALYFPISVSFLCLPFKSFPRGLSWPTIFLLFFFLNLTHSCHVTEITLYWINIHSSFFLGIRTLILYRGLMDSAKRLHFLTSITPRWGLVSEIWLRSRKQKWCVRFQGRLLNGAGKCPLLPSLPLISCLECRHDGQSLWSHTGRGHDLEDGSHALRMVMQNTGSLLRPETAYISPGLHTSGSRQTDFYSVKTTLYLGKHNLNW